MKDQFKGQATALRYAVSKKSDGNMSFHWGNSGDVIHHRKKFLENNDISASAGVVMNLSHGTEIKLADGPKKGAGIFEPGGIEADCLVTREPGVFLFLLTADCLPVTFYEPTQKILALAHVSRRNTATFATKIVKTVSEQFGCAEKKLLVNIGPAIHQESYLLADVPEKNSSKWKPFLHPQLAGQTAIDLIGYNQKQLLNTGVLLKNITVSNINTATSSNYFSHYRDRRTGEPEGRFATVVGMV